MIIIRELELIEEIHEVEEIQKEVWGISDRDIVPMTQLVAARETGGTLLGAFDGTILAGFTYGFVGYEHGQLTLHSHMLAVKPTYRNHNIGYKLKMAQRERALARGIKRMTWTFDPLQSLNAHFNFGKLGVVADQYKINFYGESSSSFLHHAGTDRLWVSWLLDSERVRERIENHAGNGPFIAEIENRVPLVAVGGDGLPRTDYLKELLTQPYALIEIPDRIGDIQEKNPELAVSWREATRWAFSEALASGYLVEEFYRLNRLGQSIGAYLLNAGKKIELNLPTT